MVSLVFCAKEVLCCILVLRITHILYYEKWNPRFRYNVKPLKRFQRWSGIRTRKGPWFYLPKNWWYYDSYKTLDMAILVYSGGHTAIVLFFEACSNNCYCCLFSILSQHIFTEYNCSVHVTVVCISLN